MSTKDTYKPSRNDLLHDLEDIKSSLEQEVFGDLLADAPPKNAQQRELEAALEKEVFGAADTSPDDAVNEDDVPLLTEVSESVVDLSEISLDEEELDESALTVLSDEDAQLEQDLAQVLAEEESHAITPQAPATALANAAAGGKKSRDSNVVDRSKLTPVDAQASLALPGQQSLFDDPKTAPPVSKKSKPVATPSPSAATKAAQETAKKAENPFLPAHIRERLHKNQENLALQELAQVGDALAKTESKSVANPVGLSTEETALIDALVARYLPEIEKELRQQLAEKIAKKPVTP